MDGPALLILFAGLGVAVLVLPRGRGAVIAAEGLAAFAIGLASLVLSAGWWWVTPADVLRLNAAPSFLLGSTAMLVLGPVCGLLGAAIAWRSTRTTRVWLGALLSAAVAVALLPLLSGVGWQALVVALALGAAIALAAFLGRRSHFGTLVRYTDRQVFARWHWREEFARPTRGDLVWVAVALGGVVAVTTVPPILVVIGALAAAAGVYVLAMRLAGGPKFPVLPLVTAGLLPFAVILQTHAGGGWVPADLAASSLTTELEIQLLPLVAVAAWGLAALWPLHGLVPRGVLAPVGGIVLLRLGADLLPAGLYLWQPILSPLALVSVWWGALTGSRTLLLTGWAFQALVTGLVEVRVAALLLLWLALAMGILGFVQERYRGTVERLVAALAALGILWTLPSMMDTQLIYSLMAMAGIGVSLWRRADP